MFSIRKIENKKQISCFNFNTVLPKGYHIIRLRQENMCERYLLIKKLKVKKLNKFKYLVIKYLHT